jgi:hypothetical protein
MRSPAAESPSDHPPGPATSTQATPLAKPVRKRSKAHLVFVASQPCLVCHGGACDAHHLKIAQPRSLGRKVSDEFTVPLCRKHHHELHRHGNERAWWQNHQIDPLPVAATLWLTTNAHGSIATPMAVHATDYSALPERQSGPALAGNDDTKPSLRPEAG